MKAAFAILLGLHGVIHLIGFLKAFELGKFPLLSEQISRTHGLFWLLATLLFLLTLLLYALEKPSWAWLAIATVLFSQMLLIITWADTKHGTWFNIVILLVAVVSIAKIKFDQNVSAEVVVLYTTQNEKEEVLPTPEKPRELPPVVGRWIEKSGARGFREVRTVYLRQKGEMKTNPKGKWMPFTAEQWFSVKEPGFVWKTRVNMAGPLFLSGRDKFISGKGTMDISFLSLFPVVRSTGDPKINQASGIRYLAEICWFPTGALEPYLTWEPVGDYSAKATFQSNPEITGIFTFDEDGNVVSFEAMRYKDSGENAQLEKWTVRNTAHKSLGGLRIPLESEVYWTRAEGEFNWLKLEIEEIEYN